MISVMSDRDFELDRKSDVIEDEQRANPRVSPKNDVVSSDKVTNGGGHLIGSDENGFFHGGDVGSSDKVIPGGNGGDEGMSLDSTGGVGVIVSMGLEIPASETENIGVSDGHANVSHSSGSEKTSVSVMDEKRNDECNQLRVCESKDEDAMRRVSENECQVGSDGAELLEYRVEIHRVHSGEKGHAELTSRTSEDKVGVRSKMGHSVSKVGKGHVEVGKLTVSQGDAMLSMFDKFAVKGKSVGHGHEIGDMVWGRVKSHPWWPGHIYNEAFASQSVRRSKRDGHVLVAFFGDSSYGWFDPAELIPFDLNFAEKSRQTYSRTFMKAVEEAVDEATRRRGLGLACRCRIPNNFRPMNVEGYFAVVMGDYEPASVYSASQIKKARDSFQPRETFAFIKDLAMIPTGNEHGSINFIKSKATVLAYRKAVFEEFDETYAQAFGYQPVRPSREPTEALTHALERPYGAPLSGPLVIAEALGKRKSSVKPNKKGDQSKKDRYLFKRRDEPNELKISQTNQGQASASTKPVFVEGSSAFAAGDYESQKRAPVDSARPEVPAEHEHIGIIVMKDYSSSSRDVTSEEVGALEEKPAVQKFSVAGSELVANKLESTASSPVARATGYSSHIIEGGSSIDKGKVDLHEREEGSRSDVAVVPTTVDGSAFSGKGVYPGVVDDMSCTFEPSMVEGLQEPSGQPIRVEEWHGREQLQDSHSGANLLVANDAMLHVEGSRIRTDSTAKKAKVRKRPLAELSTENSVQVEKKKKKKRRKEMSMELSSDHVQMHADAGKGGASVGKISGKSAGKSVQLAMAPRDDFQLDHLRKDDGATPSFLPDSVGMQQMVGIGNTKAEVPQLLRDLQSLALDPFHGVERKSPAIIRQVILRFRSIVYQKSLASLPPAEHDSSETPTSKSSSIAATSDNPAAESVRGLPPPKPTKPLVRPDDPTKGGRKRGPSDRQEEMAAKKLKKIKDVKLLAAEKKAAQKTPEVQRNVNETVAQRPTKAAVKLEGIKKMERPARTLEPTMLVMKFPPGGTLPSISELKMRFARFGPLDHSATRVFWKSATCRLVYRYKLDAQAACKFAMGSSNLFGYTNVRCHIRELGALTGESESGNIQREDVPQLRDSALEQRSASQRLQHQVQLKSCLKKSSGDDSGPVSSASGGRVIPRVKFMLGGEDNNRGEQLLVGNENNNNGSFADADGSSCSYGMEISSKNFQKVTPPSTLPILPLPSAQFPKAPNNLHHNFNTPVALPIPSSTSKVDISQPMLSLLIKCNDVVIKVSDFLGYVPYHPL